MEQKIKVLIVDDSKVSRDLLQYVIELDPHIEVIGLVENGLEALQFIKQKRPDVIMTDIQMPVMNGFQLTKKIMETNPIPIIVVSGHYNQAEVATTFEAIDAGALAILEKPKGLGDAQCIDTARFVAETIRTMSKVVLKSEKQDQKIPLHKKQHSAGSFANSSLPSKNIDLVAIGASVGGPKALRSILSQLDKEFAPPILIVQHITEGFIEGFIHWLNNATTFTVALANNGDRIQSGHVYVCPTKHYMSVSQTGHITLTPIPLSDTKERPIDHLFHACRDNFGSSCIGVLLTGMGDDGSEELLKLKEAGALTIVQDEESAIQHELPKSAIDLSAASCVAPLQQIPSILEQASRRKVSLHEK